MNQYSPKNQLFLTAEAANRGMAISDVRSFRAWKAAGRSVKKGEKALHVWIPKHGKARPTEAAMAAGLTDGEMREYFVRGPVFDISQTKPTPPSKKAGTVSARTEGQLDAMYTAYDAAIAAGEIPADLDFSIWYELTMESRQRAGTIATQDGVVIAQYQHVDLDDADRLMTAIINRTDGNAGTYATA